MSGEWDITYNVGGSFTITSKNYGCDFVVPALISRVESYVISLVGIVIMLCNVPSRWCFSFDGAPELVSEQKIINDCFFWNGVR